MLFQPLPVFSMIYGMMKAAFNYKVKRVRLDFENLPPSFDQLKIVQISDLHAGSFKSSEPIEHAVQLINKQKPDIIFFTGDLVNYETSEVKPYIDILRQIQPEMGVYSILGNHDYGNYKEWSSKKAFDDNFNEMIEVHKELGWHLLRNESTVIKRGNDSLAILGVENWSSLKRFKNYGELSTAYKGIENQPFKILLSHDPTHWNKEVTKEYPEIDLTFSGHTHGMQFGFDFSKFKMSPAKMVYKHWAGLYHKENQYLYVNRGLGFMGFPARVGVYPEITVIELGKIPDGEGHIQ